MIFLISQILLIITIIELIALHVKLCLIWVDTESDEEEKALLLPREIEIDC